MSVYTPICWVLMKNCQKASVLLLVILLSLFIIPTSKASASQDTSVFQAKSSFLSQNLYISIQPSLYAYYGNLSHSVSCNEDYAKYITPHAIQSIADNIQKASQNMPYSDEQFADAVLTLVHQIPYNITGVKYPVETLVDNSGDCVALSLLAASIMKAGGLDVILIRYTGINPGHINVGVYLPYTPVYHNLLMTLTSLKYDNKTYWVAEATPARDWKVGDQPDSIANAIPTGISIDNCEESSPGQISSNIGSPLAQSSVTTSLSEQSSNIQEGNRSLVIFGSVQPPNPYSPVSIYISKNGSSTSIFKTVTDSLGYYELTWNFTSAGIYYITSSWSGCENASGTDGETLTVFVGPEFLVQFDAGAYNYVIGRAIADLAIRPYVGINDFLKIPLGTNVSFSYDFAVLQTGHTASGVQTENVTVPANERAATSGFRRMGPSGMPTQNVTVPVNIPQGLEPLRLPDDFDQMINNQFSFIVQSNNESNYSLDVKGLNDFDVSNIKHDNESNTAFLNATENIQESTWYTVKTTISNSGITANIQNANGTSIQTISTPFNATNSNQLVLLIANSVGSAVVLKDLKIQTINSVQLPVNVKQTPDGTSLQFQSVFMLVLLVLAFVAVAVYVKKKKQHGSLSESEIRDNNRN
jgi:hypothetical protein